MSKRQSFLSRTTAVTLQSFPSGLPLGLVLTAVPTWLALEGVDIKTIGFVTLAQAPWTFKFLWSPLMDRYAPPFLGRKRGWAVVAQAALFATTLALAVLAAEPQRIRLIAFVTLLIAFASASQDIAVDAYAVEVLHRDEQGVAAGARTAMARFAFFLSGRVVVSAARWISWPLLFAAQALVYLPSVLLMAVSPVPERPPPAPSTLRKAVWEPFVGFLRQHRAIEIALFLTLYKFGDNLASSLVSPFLIQTGFDLIDVGVAAGTIGLAGMILGAVVGGALTTRLGLGHALWLFGLLQAFSNIGYVLIADLGVRPGVMYGAMAIEALTSGMGTAAFSVLLLRLTQKRFSATQYALLSSIFALGRTVAGPLAGVLVDALGWHDFFLFTIAAAVPGLVMLQRFAPFGFADPDFALDETAPGEAHAPTTLLPRAIAGVVLGATGAAGAHTLLVALRVMHHNDQARFDLLTPARALLHPASAADWMTLAGIAACGLVFGLAAAALTAARNSARNS